MSRKYGPVPCPADVFIDGRAVRLYRWKEREGWELIVLAGIDEFVVPADVEAVEVYRRASELPARFGGATEGCGAVVIWTR